MAKGIFFVPAEGLSALIEANADALVVFTYLLLAELTGRSGEISKGGEATMKRRYGVGSKKAKEALASLADIKRYSKDASDSGTPIVQRESAYRFLNGLPCTNMDNSWIVNTFPGSRKVWLKKEVVCNKKTYKVVRCNPEVMKMLMLLYLGHDYLIDAVHPQFMYLYTEDYTRHKYNNFSYCFAKDVNKFLFKAYTTNATEKIGNDGEVELSEETIGIVNLNTDPHSILKKLYKQGFIDIRYIASNDPHEVRTWKDDRPYIVDVKSSVKKNKKLPMLRVLEEVSAKIGHKSDRRLHRYPAIAAHGEPQVIGLIRSVHIASNTGEIERQTAEAFGSAETQIASLAHSILESELPSEIALIPEDLPSFL